MDDKRGEQGLGRPREHSGLKRCNAADTPTPSLASKNASISKP